MGLGMDFKSWDLKVEGSPPKKKNLQACYVGPLQVSLTHVPNQPTVFAHTVCSTIRAHPSPCICYLPLTPWCSSEMSLLLWSFAWLLLCLLSFTSEDQNGSLLWVLKPLSFRALTTLYASNVSSASARRCTPWGQVSPPIHVPITGDSHINFNR